MTDDRPATDSPDEPRQLEAFLSFGDQVASLPGPRNWVIAATNDSDPHAAEPHVTAVLPMPRGVTVEQWLARHGAVPGTYLARLEPITGSANAKRSKLDRLQTRGATTAQLRVTPADVAAAERFEAANNTAKAAAAGPQPLRREEAQAVKRKREEVELQRAENERLAAELEYRRLQSELRKLEGSDQAPATGSLGGMLAAVAPLLPVVKDIVGGWLDNQRKQIEAMQALAERATEPVTVAAPASPLSLSSLLDLLPQVKELGKLLANFGAGGRADRDDDDEPQSETLQMLGMVRDLVSQFGGAAPSPAAVEPAALPEAPATPALAPARAARRELSPQDQMNLRVLQFFAIVQREQSVTADPEAVAERLFPQIGTLPAAFRQLLFTASSANDLLTALPQWLPPGRMRTEVPNAIRQSQERMAWLSTFLETVQDIAKGPEEDPDEPPDAPFDGNDSGP